MSPERGNPQQIAATQKDLSDLARELIDKVGVDGAIRYCDSLGWGGVRAQIQAIRAMREGNR